MVINPKMLTSVKPLQEVISIHVLQQNIREDICITPWMRSDFSQIHILMWLPRAWEREGKAPDLAKPRIRFGFQYLQTSFRQCPIFKPGSVPRPQCFVLPSFWEHGASQKPRQTWCSLLLGYVWLTFPEGKSSGK